MSIHDDDRYFLWIHDDSQTFSLRFNANTLEQIRKPTQPKTDLTAELIITPSLHGIYFIENQR